MVCKSNWEGGLFISLHDLSRKACFSPSQYSHARLAPLRRESTENSGSTTRMPATTSPSSCCPNAPKLQDF